MSASPLGVRALPAIPNLEQQKKLARELLDAARANDPDAVRRFRAFHPRHGELQLASWPPEKLALHDAQLVIAREYGMASWPKLKTHIESVRAERQTRPLERHLQYYEDRAHGLREVLADGAPATIEQVRSWHPRFADASDAAIIAASRSDAFTLDDARLVYARQHGFATWVLLGRHLRRVAAGEVEEPLLLLVEAGKRGDWQRVLGLLEAHPDLVHARGTNGNTLLNLACGLIRQGPGEHCAAATTIPGGDRLAPLRLLLSAGADPNMGNDRGWKPLHDAAYGNDSEVAALLLSSGARHEVEAHGSGGTPLVVALFWGNREAAEVIAGAGVAPRNLRTAAGLGRIDLLQDCFTASDHLTSLAMSARGFYRPHSGFPSWRPSDDPQEVLDEALTWAARSGRRDALDFLVRRGARMDADPYRGTPLVWAASCGRRDAVQWLLEQGADVNQRSSFGGPEHGKEITALHITAQHGDLETVRVLLASGADPTIRDALYDSPPAGWAAHGGHAEMATYLERAAEAFPHG